MQKRAEMDLVIETLEFTFDKNFPVYPPWGLYTVGEEDISSLHYHNAVEFGYCYKGTGVFFVNNKILPFSSGDASIIFKNEAHKAQSHKNNLSEWKFVAIDVDSLLSCLSLEQFAPVSKIIFGGSEFENVIKSNEHQDIINLIQALIDETEAQRDGYKSVVTGLTWALMTKLTRIINADDKNGIVDNNNSKLTAISPALNYLSENYYEEICADKLANLCNLSTAHFRRVFKTTMMLSPIEYLYHIRIKMATILLHKTSLSVMEIAMQVGYSSITSFNRHFKRIIRVTPREWRGID